MVNSLPTSWQLLIALLLDELDPEDINLKVCIAAYGVHLGGHFIDSLAELICIHR